MPTRGYKASSTLSGKVATVLSQCYIIGLLTVSVIKAVKMLKVLLLLSVSTVIILQYAESSIPASTCKSRAAPVGVGLPGTPGKEGPPGTPGASGEQGSPGPIGNTGLTGPAGPPGTNGVAGLQGPPGMSSNKGQQGPTGPPGVKGDQGLQGSPGTKGSQGPQGSKGAKGAQGAQGPQGNKGDLGQKGSQGINGTKGDQGFQGSPGVKGEQGLKGQKGTAGENYVGGSTYTRWGHSNCSNISGTSLVYAGIAAGTRFGHKGGGANLLCLPLNPVYSSYSPGTQDRARLGPVEFHPSVSFGSVVFDDNVQCAVCKTTRPTTIMIPATIYCPLGWTREYYGYLMAEHKDNNRGTFVCIDSSAQPYTNSTGHTREAHDLYNVEAYCNIIPCPPYNNYKELTCVVCSQ